MVRPIVSMMPTLRVVSPPGSVLNLLTWLVTVISVMTSTVSVMTMYVYRS